MTLTDTWSAVGALLFFVLFFFFLSFFLFTHSILPASFSTISTRASLPRRFTIPSLISRDFHGKNSKLVSERDNYYITRRM